MSVLGNFHLLRPEWLLALVPLALLLMLARRRGVGESHWHQVIPAELLRHLMPQGNRSQRKPLFALALLWLVAVIALAGPAWQKEPQPLQAKSDHLVVILDLSLSTLATDLQPNRLTRAKQKLSDLLQQRQDCFGSGPVHHARAGQPPGAGRGPGHRTAGKCRRAPGASAADDR